MIKITDKFYVCTYSDYGGLPGTLYSNHVGSVIESLDTLKFIAIGEDRNDPSLSWMLGTEPEYSHSGILTVLDGVEWNDEI
jgi:hypothetical protein